MPEIHPKRVPHSSYDSGSGQTLGSFRIAFEFLQGISSQ